MVVAVAEGGSDRVAMLINSSVSGAISFGGLTIRPAPGRPTAIAAGDFKSDGHPDLVIASDVGNVLYLDNDPATGFALVTTAWATSPQPTAIAVADFNLDGNLDVATTSLGTDQASILLGKGTGSFQGAVSYGIAGAPAQGLVAGDFNRDGRPDLASRSGTATSLPVLLNTNCHSRPIEG